MGSFKSIGKFDVVDKIGEGSFGVVYRGYDPFLKRDVAIKVCSLADEGLRQRFAREGQISGNLHHRNIVTVFAYGHEGDIPYLVQEFLSGEDLDQVVKKQAPLVPIEKLGYLRQIATGMAYAHEQGIVHRDIKPANIRLLDDGQIKIMDFGIAKLASAETQLTQKGVTLGTASYLPPEQVRGGEVDHRADIFSFGVLAYELLTYERPFRGNTLSALVYQILYKSPLPISSIWEECPAPLSNLVSHCLEKKVDRRIASFDEVIPELDALIEGAKSGEWPMLDRVPQLTNAQSGESGDSEILSQSIIQRAAQSADRSALEGTGNATVGIGAVRPDSKRRGVGLDTDSTQPVEAIPPLEGVPAETATVRIDIPDQLTARGEEIARLVAQGDLQKAKEQLDQTVEWQRSSGDATNPSPEALLDPEGTAATPPASAKEDPDETLPPPPPPSLDSSSSLDASLPPSPPPVVPRAPVRPDAKTEVLSERAISASVPASQSGTSQAPHPKTAPAKAAPETVLPKQTNKTAAAARSGSYGSLQGLWPVWGRRVLLGLAALVVAGIALQFLLPDSEPVVEAPAPTPVPAVQAPPPPRVVETPTGGVIVDARPWAAIVSIVDSNGQEQALPDRPYTPIYLRLPPEVYQITIEHPDHEDDSRICEVEVGPEVVASCDEVFGAERSVDYFKEAGWWQ